MNSIWRVSTYLFRYKSLFYLTLLLAALMTLAGVSIPWVIKVILEDIQESQHLGTLWKGTALIAGLYFLRELFNSLRIRINNVLEQKVLVDMRHDLHQKLLNLPVSFYDNRKSGEISSRVIDDVNNVERALLDGTEQGTTAVLTLVGVTAFLFFSQPLLAFLVFLPVPVLLGIGIVYAKNSRTVWKQVRESSADLNSLLVEDIQGNRLIQSFGLQEKETRRFKEKAEDLRKKTLRGMFRWASYHPSTNFVTNLGVVAILGLGGTLILQDNSTFDYPDLIAFFLYATMLYQPLSQLHGINHMLAAGKASGDRVFEILDEKIDIVDAPQTIPFPSNPKAITFDQVSFHYPNRDAVISDLHLTLPAGKMTAIVGHTGAGKTTVANLLLRSYDPTSGTVRIGDSDLRKIKLSDLRQKIGFVAQDPFLFEGTISENLLLAKPDASEDEVIEALKGAAAWDFVKHLPDGIHTNIGEKGIRLSQGEKQRLTIARVLIKNPPIVIFDEATASVDTITERSIQIALEHLMESRTVLVIAHRLSTIAKADQIIVLEKGKIIDRGTHQELLQKESSHYARLWAHQNDAINEASFS